MKKIFAIGVAALALTGCEQAVTRNFGGDMAYEIPAGTQLVGITWKQSNMWVLYYDPNTKACTFKESSLYGALEGSVTIKNCNPVTVE